MFPALYISLFILSSVKTHEDRIKIRPSSLPFLLRTTLILTEVYGLSLFFRSLFFFLRNELSKRFLAHMIIMLFYYFLSPWLYFCLEALIGFKIATDWDGKSSLGIEHVQEVSYLA